MLEDMSTLKVKRPWNGSLVGEVELLDAAKLETAVARTARAFDVTKEWSRAERAEVLHEAARNMGARHGEFADLITAEGGKPITLARGEVDRAITTIRTSAEEARRSTGELVPLDGEAPGAGKVGIFERFPLGPVLAITPFNFPLNLVCHKVGPALAAGNSVLIKPSGKTPLTAFLLAECFAHAGDAVTVAPTTDDLAEGLASDPRFDVLTFTGSSDVGWMLRRIAGHKRVILELGGNAPCIIEPDADLEHAAARVTWGGVYQGGQSCVSVQRVLVNRAVYDRFLELLVPAMEAVVTGDPREERTLNGPLITSDALDRVEAWVNEAAAQGAKVLVGGERRGSCYAPTVLVNVNREMKVSCQEIFGPVVTVQPYNDLDEALAIANDSDFGLQGALFTRDISKVMKAHRELRVGGLIHNEVSAFRVDPMPYGGVKASGHGREGVKYAVAEMSEERLLVIDSG